MTRDGTHWNLNWISERVKTPDDRNKLDLFDSLVEENEWLLSEIKEHQEYAKELQEEIKQLKEAKSLLGWLKK